MDSIPLSFTQESLWLLEQIEGDNSLYNETIALRLTGDLNTHALRHALADTVARHESLRTTFSVDTAGEPRQVIHPADFTLPELDLTDLPANQQQDKIQSLFEQAAKTPFDLMEGPLFRCQLLCLSSGQTAASHVLLMVMHHLIIDAWSIGLLVREVSNVYAALIAGKPSPLPDLPIQYADYAIWQRSHLQGEVLADHLAYWKQQLSDAPALLQLPTDRPRPAHPSFCGSRAYFTIAADCVQKLNLLAQNNSATLFMVLLAAFNILLARYSRQNDILVGAPMANRQRQELESLIGYFTNTIVLRTRLNEQHTFPELLAQVKKTLHEAAEHQDVAFSSIVSAVQPERDTSYSPLFQVLFAFQNIPTTRNLDIAGLQMSNLKLDVDKSKYDLFLELFEGSSGLSDSSSGLSGSFEYNTDLFDAATIGRMITHFRALLSDLVAQPDQLIQQISFLTAADISQMQAWNETATDYPADKTLVDLFADQVMQTPDDIAVSFKDETLTYHQLNTRANQLAHYLCGLTNDQNERLIQPDTLVGIGVDRSLDMIVGLLGILKAGGAYVPLDPDYPAERLAYMLADSQVPVLLTQQRLQAQLPDYVGEIVCLDDPALFADQPEHNLPHIAQPYHLVYVLFTSGSTGKPKGVMIEHQALNNLISDMQKRISLPAQTEVLSLTTLSFDIAGLELYLPLIQGARIRLVDRATANDAEALKSIITTQAMQLIQATPATWQLLQTSGWQARQPLTILCGGEVLHPQVGAYLLRQSTQLWNVYGPTETTIWSTAHNVTVQPEYPERIGRPIANTRIYILNEQARLVPIGIPGELCIAGAGLARGYFNRPDLTAERFIDIELFGKTERVYKTGDLARWLPDGHLEYLGRIDHQVKLRGFRIELGEIESVLRQHSSVSEAVVVVYEREDNKTLAAYVTAAEDEVVEVVVLQDALRARLPEYMVPGSITLLDQMPLTPNGKLDRRALPAPDYVDLQTTFVAPRNEAEQQLADIWMSVLRLDKVGVHDNFFALGGHSLLATQVIARIREVFSVDLGLRTLFATPTIAANARALQKQSQTTGTLVDTFPEIVPAPVQRNDPFPLTDVQHAYWVGRSSGIELGNISAHVYFEFDSDIINYVRLNQAWQGLIQRHEMLRAIIQTDGQQRILPVVPDYLFAVTDLTDQGDTEAEQVLASIRHEMSHQVLSADQWPLFDIRVTHINARNSRLHVSLDALILDAASMGTLFAEWMTLYQNPQAVLPTLNVSFRDYVLAEKAFEENEPYQQAWCYWQQRLESLPPAPELPLRPGSQKIVQPRFRRHAFQLAAEQWSNLKHYGHQAGLTDSTIILTVFAEVLTCWSKRAHFTLNLTLFNRLPFHPQINDIIGDFTPLLMLEVDNRVNQDGRQSFQDRAQQIQRQLWADLDHRVVNGVRVLREWAKYQDRDINQALMPVVFTSMLAVNAEHDLADDALGKLVYLNNQTPQIWLDHIVVETGGALDISWSVVEGLFPDGMIEAMFTAYTAVLQRLATGTAVWQQTDLMLVPQSQLQQQARINATDAPVSEAMLHTLFLQQAEAQPDALAVISPGRSLTYQDLSQRANQVGHWLRAQGARPNTLIAVVMEKGWEQVVAVLGIHLAGAAYLPIDPGVPTERLHTLLAQGAATIALTQHAVAADQVWPESMKTLAIDTLVPEETCPALADVQTPTDLAYVIYTSGSTGQPKGVAIDHRGAVNTILDVNQRYGITSQDRVLSLSALNFDLSVYDIFGLLAAGGVIVLPEARRRTEPGHWCELIQQHDVTVWNTVPALMQMLLDDTGALSSTRLQVVMLSGDWIPLSLPERIQIQWPEACIYSMGGATEASIWSIYYPIKAVDPAWASIPYGKPMTNQTFHVLDDELRPRPVWVTGDLYIGGTGLAQGYWQDEVRTQASFIRHPETGQRLYKTGDLGRYLPDGNIEFSGREDFQVKVRGHRIELVEIETILQQHPGVSEAIVNAAGDPKGNRQLVGYVVLDDDQEATNQLPDAYVTDPAITVLDPIERLEFKLRQPGVRQLSGEPVHLPDQGFDETHRDTWLARRSHRQFLSEAIDVNTISDFLSCLRQMPLQNMPLPKYRYPSAGNLYPVQCYVYIKPERINGIVGGYYYYQPAAHHLLPLQVDDTAMNFIIPGINQTIFEQSAFTLFLVTDLTAIAPLYGEVARDFSLLEAGYMSQLLMMEASQYNLGLCPVGGVDVSQLQQVLAFGDQHQLLHTLVGGYIDSCQTDQFLQGSAQVAVTPDAWQTELHDYLAQKLPDYMVPTILVKLESMPLTPSGKLDRRGLPEPDLSALADSTYHQPRTLTEQRLVEIWENTLDIHPVGIFSNFFESGGNSLTAVQLLSSVQRVFGQQLPLRTLFEYPTVADMAGALEQMSDTDVSTATTSSIVTLQAEGTCPPLYFLPGAGGGVLNFYQLAREMGDNQPCHALELAGLDGKATPLTRVEAVAAYQIEQLLSYQPSGPYHLAGHSFGGFIVLEMARQLLKAGADVGSVIMLDTYGLKDNSVLPDTIEVILVYEHYFLEERGAVPTLTRSQLEPLTFEESLLLFKQSLEDAGSLPENTPLDQVRNIINVAYASLRAIADYQPTERISLPIHLLLATDEERDAEETEKMIEFWSRCGELMVHEVPGTHINMIYKPNVATVAKTLASCLQS